MANLLGLCFLLVCDQLIETSFGQIMIIPNVFPVYKREVSNNMYRPTPFYIARIIASITLFILYPLTVTMTVIWCLGLPVMGFAGWVSFWCILMLTAFVGSVLGLAIGAVFPNPFTALNVNTMVFIMISFGGGIYVNTGSGANFLVKFISWISPLHYSVELLMRRMFEGKNEEFTEYALTTLGFTDGISMCVFMLVIFYFVYVAIGIAAVHWLAKQ